MSELMEKDFLKYRSNRLPRVIRFAWTVFFLFGIAYLFLFAWPDLKEWFTRL